MLGFVGVVRLDVQERLVLADEGWLDYLRRALGPDLTEAAALGRPFADFAPDKELAALYTLVFRRVRAAGQPMRVPFRCDVAGERWHMDIEVSPLADGQVECRYHCVLVESIGPSPTGNVTPERLLTRCAWCQHVKLPEGDWVGVDALADRLDFFIGEASRLTHGICPACEAAVRATFNFAE